MSGTGSIRVAFRGALGPFALDAAFTAPARGITAVFGPSGCGKTTVLRCIAGLQKLPGACDVNGDIWQDPTVFRRPHQRPVGYVFQEASLFPHLSVRSNLLYGAPRGSVAMPDQAISFDEVIGLLGLAELLERSPQNLSGGERQRVAIGRALLSQPRLLLMDEPLSALDRMTKDEILPFLERLHERLSLPVLYVSHDMSEVERLADHLVLMQAGRVIAAGPLAELQSDPQLPLAAMRAAAVSFDGVVDGYDHAYGLATLRIEGGTLQVPAAPTAPGTMRRIRIGASDVSVALERPRDTSVLNILPARVMSATAIGHHEVLLVLRLGHDEGGARLLARLTRRSVDHLGLKPGLKLFAQMKGVSLARYRGDA